MDRIRRLQILGFGLIGLAAGLGLVALRHMRALAEYGYVCGGAAPHCPACPASLAALALGVGLLVAAGRLAPSRAPARR